MNFSSISFLLYFFPLFMILYGLTPVRERNGVLLAGSLVFCGLGDPLSVCILMGCTAFDFWAGSRMGSVKKRKGNRKIKRKSGRRTLFWLTIIVNLAVLGFFKAGLQASLFGMKKTLPLGISFYLFQNMSYLADVYMGNVKQESSFVDYATYITMFPQLIVGPIVCYDEVRRELKRRGFLADNIQEGIKVFVLGLAAKVLLADNLGILWNDVQVTGYESISTGMAWLAAIAYSLKLYFDFYGYSLMARGLGRVFGFELPRNFRTPYMARSVRDFYRRWHITLGRWFRRYVYIPLGGSRKGEWRTVCNLMVVWMLTGLWHGVTANFLIWGGILGICIVLERMVAKLRWPGFMKYAGHIYLWLVIPVSWMCFAIGDLHQLWIYLGRMFGLNKGEVVLPEDWILSLKQYGVLLGVSVLACTPLGEKVYRKVRGKWWGQALIGLLLWLSMWEILKKGNNPFMYYNF